MSLITLPVAGACEVIAAANVLTAFKEEGALAQLLLVSIISLNVIGSIRLLPSLIESAREAHAFTAADMEKLNPAVSATLLPDCFVSVMTSQSNHGLDATCLGRRATASTRKSPSQKQQGVQKEGQGLRRRVRHSDLGLELGCPIPPCQMRHAVARARRDMAHASLETS